MGERERVPYADDTVLLAEQEEEMRSMARFEEYLERESLELNTSKAKVMRFRKGRGRMDRKVWKWRGKVIEEIKEYKYLGYTLQRNGEQKTHIKDRVKRAAAGQFEGKRFGKDWRRRIWLFDRLIWTVMS